MIVVCNRWHESIKIHIGRNKIGLRYVFGRQHGIEKFTLINNDMPRDINLLLIHLKAYIAFVSGSIA